MNIDTNADIIEHLPTNKGQPSHNELQLMDKLFYSPNTNSALINEIYKITLMFLIFVIMNLDIVGDMIKRLVPSTQNSQYIFIGVKGLLFVLTYWIIDNFWLSRKE